MFAYNLLPPAAEIIDLDAFVNPRVLTALTVTPLFKRDQMTRLPRLFNNSKLQKLSLSVARVENPNLTFTISGCSALREIYYCTPTPLSIVSCTQLNSVEFHPGNDSNEVTIRDCGNLKTLRIPGRNKVSLYNCPSIETLDVLSLHHCDALSAIGTLNIRLLTRGYLNLLNNPFGLCSLTKLSLSQLVNGTVILPVGLEQLVIWDLSDWTDIRSVTIRSRELECVYLYCSESTPATMPYTLLTLINMHGDVGFLLKTFSIAWKCSDRSC